MRVGQNPMHEAWDTVTIPSTVRSPGLPARDSSMLVLSCSIRAARENGPLNIHFSVQRLAIPLFK